MDLFYSSLVGLAVTALIVWITEYYTGTNYRPVQSIARSSQTGHGTNIIQGLAISLESTALPTIVIIVGLIASFQLAGFLGVAFAASAMLALAGMVVALDAYGPVTDNAGGIAEMAGLDDSVREKTDALDAVGNTTKALTKGYAIGSASLAAFLLFSAYLEEIKVIVADKVHMAGGYMPAGWNFTNINLAQVPVFVGALLGAMLTYLFSSMAIKAVGRTAQMIVKDVRDQFKENPGIMAGTSKPDYGRCVHIVTGAALKEMVLPGLLVVCMPVAVGLIFRHLSASYHASSAMYAAGTIIPVPAIAGIPVNLAGAESVAGLLMVGTIAGILLAMLMNNGGGAWDNAKKFIETGQYGGKKSEAHKASVVGDTVGDPFKDTAGPSLHVLIKLLATITLVLAPLFV
jgi:K(+)-stimulated pyrophosphate-energized sodium pump